jgi:L-lysine exporter family protein LysE/ArgO
MIDNGAALALQGLVIGVMVAAPLGPVNIAMIDRGLRDGFRGAYLLGVGSTLADLVYILIAYAGADPLSRQPWARVLLFGAGAVVLAYLGVGAIRSARAARAEPALGGPEGGRKHGPFAAGVFITLLNPMTIASWLGILGAALAARPREGAWVEVLFITSLVAGCQLWVLALSAALHGGRRLVQGPVLRVVSVVAGVTLIGFGVSFALKAAASW